MSHTVQIPFSFTAHLSLYIIYIYTRSVLESILFLLHQKFLAIDPSLRMFGNQSQAGVQTPTLMELELTDLAKKVGTYPRAATGWGIRGLSSVPP